MGNENTTFLTNSRILWQEGHTAHATREALEETKTMLQVYRDFCHETLAVPVVCGVKTANERFAGADDTYTIEAMMQNGWALQSGTSHFLGQNFAKAFDVTFQNDSGKNEFVWATSWGVSTRLIGATIMTHSDDTGLVLPPKVAPIQVIIVPIWRKDKERDEVLEFADNLYEQLKRHFRIKDRQKRRNEASCKIFRVGKKGVPLRMEIGPRDVKNN